MKNTLLGKTTTQILSVLLCAVILIMIACCFCPYFTVSAPYDRYINPNPKTDHYSLVDAMWCNTDYSEYGEGNEFNAKTDFSTVIIRTRFEELYNEFNYNDYITNLVLSFIFALGTIGTTIWFAANEFRRFPSMVSGVITHICAILCSLFSLMGYINNAMLTLGNEKFMYIRSVIIVLSVAILVLSVARLVVWILTEIQLAKDKKARLALL